MRCLQARELSLMAIGTKDHDSSHACARGTEAIMAINLVPGKAARRNCDRH